METVDKSKEKRAKTVNNTTNATDSNKKMIENSKTNHKKENVSMAKALSGFNEVGGWKDILNELRSSGKIMMYSNLIKAKAIELNDMTIGISFPDGITAFGKTILEKPENLNELSKIVSMEYGKDMKVRIIENVDSLPKKEQKNETSSIENMANDLDIPLNIMDNTRSSVEKCIMAKRGGFPGMGGFGGMNINQLMKEAKKMQTDMEKSQEELATKEFEATAGGGAVYVKVSGNKEIKEIKIKQEVVDPDDVEMLQDLILTSVNEALRKVDSEQAAALGKYNIPGLM